MGYSEHGEAVERLKDNTTNASGVAASYIPVANPGVIAEYAPVIKDGTGGIMSLCGGNGITTRAETTNGFCHTTNKSSCNASYSRISASTGMACSTCANV